LLRSASCSWVRPFAFRISLSDAVARLDQLIASEGDGKTFDAGTHITHGMEVLPW